MNYQISKNFYDISKIPTDWKNIRLKYILSVSDSKSLNFSQEKILSLTQKGIVERNITTNEGQIAKSYEKYILVKQGQICMNPMDLLSGWVDISSYDGLISPAYYTFILNKEFDNKFINYFLQSNYLRKTFFKLGKGVASHDNFGRWVLTPEELKNIFIFFPQIEEQKLISRYLDKKTKQIDRLVLKFQKKVKLLQEQRTSLIKQYITKGLDLNVEMKDSGAKWIGDIPKHWEIKKLKYIGDQKSGDGFKVELQGNLEGDFPFYKVSDTNIDGNEKYLSISNNYLNKDIVDKNQVGIFPKNTIIFPKIGEVLKLNKRRIALRECCIDNNMMGLILSSKDIPEFVYFYMTLVNFDLYCSDGTIPSISESQVGQIIYISPPIHEQKSIIETLTNKLKLQEKIVLSEKRRIQTLIEYRQTLIFSFITGKVRITEDMI